MPSSGDDLRFENMLRMRTIAPVPAETMRVAKEAIPEGNTCLALRDRLGTIFEDGLFASR
jgi:hypothetical protein